jgi:mRNA-degrading endonuclease toxin of MazEF toxin-antitoxin module
MIARKLRSHARKLRADPGAHKLVAGNDTSKPRPAVMVQDEACEATASINICALTTDPTDPEETPKTSV